MNRLSPSCALAGLMLMLCGCADLTAPMTESKDAPKTLTRAAANTPKPTAPAPKPTAAKPAAKAPAGEQIGASHILIGFKGAARSKATRTKDEATREADRLIKEAAKPGADFAELAKKHSDGPSAPRGGALGKFGKGRMVPAFEQAAFALKPGEVTKKPVETQFGFHIIKRTE